MDNRLIVSILKLRKSIQEFYQKHNTIVAMLAKGLAAFALCYAVNMMYGNTGGPMMLIGLVTAVICAVLPMRLVYVGVIILTAMHLWKVSWDVVVFYLAAALLSYLLVCRMKPDTAIIIAFTPLFFVLKIPFLMPLLVGCFSSLYGMAAMVFGIAFYYLSVYSKDVITLLSAANGGDSVIAVKSIMDSFINDADLLLLMAAFLIAAIVAYVLYHQSFDHAWYIGIAVGGFAGLVVYLTGGILFDIENGNMTYLFTIPVAIIIACIIQFFRCVIDYSGAEKLQFEDDDYYYYVKAVPKINVIVDDFAVADAVKERLSKKEESEEEK